MKVDELLEKPAFELGQKEKGPLFFEAMKESLKLHYGNCPEFKKFVDGQGIDLEKIGKVEDIPYLPVSIFKEVELVTGPRENIKTKILSSATTSGKPSQIPLDEVTSKRQQIALKNIMSSFLGKERMAFIVLDARETAQKAGAETSSRASAIRGMMPFAKSMHFVLNEKLEFEPKLLEEAVEKIGQDEKICFFGFTWLIYKTLLAIKENGKKEFDEAIAKLGKERKVLHIGGWKKLKDIAVEKKQFNDEVGEFFGVENGKVIDFYGMTEQLGTVYPDCGEGHKHLPLYSEIILRDGQTFEPLGFGKPGLIQLLTPLPNSYPGISVLTEDVGELLGVDDCPCGRKGKYFEFRKRVEKAPLKGCGDTI